MDALNQLTDRQKLWASTLLPAAGLGYFAWSMYSLASACVVGTVTTLDGAVTAPVMISLALVVAGFVIATRLQAKVLKSTDVEDAHLHELWKVSSSNMMIVSPEMEILKVNDSVKRLFGEWDAELREAMPGWNAYALEGSHLDRLHNIPTSDRYAMQTGQPYQTEVTIGSCQFEMTASPLKDDSGQLVAVLVEWVDHTEAVKLQQEQEQALRDAQRVRSALDVCQANVMMADADLNIIYLNDSVKEMLHRVESDVRSELPNFSVSQLMGTCVDDFHANPQHQRSMLQQLKTVHNTDLKIAGRTFGLIATPVYADDGERMGTVVEWEDKTEALAKQEQEAAISKENARMKMALDVCQANVMMADPELNIVYVNDSAQAMLSAAEQDVRKELPNFSARNLVGVCVDDFHKNPHHQRRMIEHLTQTFKTDLKLGGRTFGLIATPVFDEHEERIGTVVEWDDKTERLAKEEAERAEAQENSRIRQALDCVTANVMMADADNNVIYTNDAVMQMLTRAESDLRKQLPNFSASRVVGSNVDIFHAKPEHQRSMLASLKDAHRTQIVVGGRTFSLIANPIVDAKGERLGTVVEWNDRTDEVMVEEEVDNLVEAASRGEFTKRIDLSDKEGFFHSLSEGLNRLMSVAEVGLDDVLRVLKAMSGGDMTETIEADYQGTFGELKDSANITVQKLTEIIVNIRDAAATVNTGAYEIAQGNSDLSQRTEEQASSLEETAASMEEMTSTVRHTADNARQANDLAKAAQEKAQTGGNVVADAITAMETINEASNKIADIIGVIDEIAFQTNLLALNAAVEAARAGEQGRGFAVVAGEVRNLAQRSAAAAKEIKELIRDSVTKVEDGSRLVNESGSTLAEIVQAVESVTAMIEDISTASQEQTSGIEQVNMAVSQMDQMTQQNAALVEEASAAGEAMSEQANAMSSMMQFFNTGDSAVASAPRAAATPAVHSPAPLSHKPAVPAADSSVVSYNQDKGPQSDSEWEEF